MYAFLVVKLVIAGLLMCVFAFAARRCAQSFLSNVLRTGILLVDIAAVFLAIPELVELSFFSGAIILFLFSGLLPILCLMATDDS